MADERRMAPGERAVQKLPQDNQPRSWRTRVRIRTLGIDDGTIGIMSVVVFRARGRFCRLYRLENAKQPVIEHRGGTRSEGGDDLVQRQ